MTRVRWLHYVLVVWQILVCRVRVFYRDHRPQHFVVLFVVVGRVHPNISILIVKWSIVFSQVPAFCLYQGHLFSIPPPAPLPNMFKQTTYVYIAKSLFGEVNQKHNDHIERDNKRQKEKGKVRESITTTTTSARISKKKKQLRNSIGFPE